MTEQPPPIDPKLALENYISHHEKAADAMKAAAADELSDNEIRVSLANLHRGIAWLAMTVRDSRPKHEEYHKVRQVHLYAVAAARFASAGDFAQIGMRSAIIANGGALIAMLAFLGNSHRSPEGLPLWLSFGFFVTGLLCALMTVLFGYVTQAEFGRQEAAGSDKIYFHLLGEEDKAAEQDTAESKHMESGGVLERWAIGFYVAALALFVAGAVAGVIALSAPSSVADKPAIPAEATQGPPAPAEATTLTSVPNESAP